MRLFVITLLLASFALFSCQLVSFSGTANDLARHLRDGELILAGQGGLILHQNYYSYVQPKAVFINHHWLTTVLFYLIYKNLGLIGLNLFYIFLGLVTFWLFFRIAEREAGLALGASFAALLMPLLALRGGIRPEAFSLLLLAGFFSLLWGHYRGDVSPKWLWLLPVLELFWVNLHPGFALGPLITAIFLGAAWLKRAPHSRQLAIVFGLTALAGLANPNGWKGWIFPVAVANNYVMPVRENLSPLALPGVWMATLAELAVVLLAAAWIWVYLRRARIEWPLLVFSLGAGAMTLAFFRIYVFLGWFVLVAVCVNVHAIRGLKRSNPGTPAWLVIALTSIAVADGAAVLASRWDTVGLGIAPHDADLAQFLRANGIAGKVFNSYPSGGYLIHYLPEQAVYVDNRPEAYPGAFLRDEYLRALEDEDAWQSISEKYQFDYICFVRINQDEGKFLVHRVRDPQWAVVWAGKQMVLVRREQKFADVIARHEVKF